MIGSRGGADSRRMYRCAQRCKASAVTTADLLEALVIADLRQAFRHPGFQVGETATGVRTAENAVLQAEQELDAFAGDTEARRLLGDRYHQHLAQRVDDLDKAREALQAAMTSHDDSMIVIPDELWDELEPFELGEVLRGGLDTVSVSKGRQPLATRVRIVPKGSNETAALASTEDA
jgi:hypothetical protein